MVILLQHASFVQILMLTVFNAQQILNVLSALSVGQVILAQHAKSAIQE